MARIETVTSGVVHNALMNAAEAESVVREYAAEFQESGNRAGRAATVAALIEQWWAILGRNDAPEEWVNEVQALTAPALARHRALDTWHGAAATGHALARTVHTAAVVDAQHYGKRPGSWYGTTGTGSE